MPDPPAPPPDAPPGRIIALRGIVFQSDDRSFVGAWLIRPLETIDRWMAGLRPTHKRAGAARLAMHAGLHVVLDDGREVVAEQLVGTPYEDLRSGLRWTPLAEFRARDRGGWDVTIPATAFRGVDRNAEMKALQRLNALHGRPFLREDCTAFIERVFGRRLFADSPGFRALGLRWRPGDPALPLLRLVDTLDDRARCLLRADALGDLPDADPDAPGGRAWRWHLLGTGVFVGATGLIVAGALVIRRRRCRRPTLAHQATSILESKIEIGTKTQTERHDARATTRSQGRPWHPTWRLRSPWNGY